MSSDSELTTSPEKKIEYQSEILELSKKIYEYAELSSNETKSSRLLVESLQSHGFEVEYPYLDMKTAFRAEAGTGSPVLGLLCEYDALPNGHACGHNLIAAWAYGVAVNLKDRVKKGKIVVFGTPAEEGSGEYGASKITMVEKGAFKDVDFVVGTHPSGSWKVGHKALAGILIRATFLGKSSHMAASPEKGVNALDAAVTTYVAINNLRSWINNNREAVIGMVFREAGRAANVVPDRAVLSINCRAASGDFLKVLVEKIKTIIVNTGAAFGVTVELDYPHPPYEDYKENKTIDRVLEEELKKRGIAIKQPGQSKESAPGSTDESNVSKAVPTGHIDIKIGSPGIAGHSDAFREAANPEIAKENLFTAIDATTDAISKIVVDEKLLRELKSEMNS